MGLVPIFGESPPNKGSSCCAFVRALGGVGNSAGVELSLGAATRELECHECVDCD